MQNTKILAEAGEPSFSSHEDSIALLLDQLKVFRMSADNVDNARMYGRLESEFL